MISQRQDRVESQSHDPYREPAPEVEKPKIRLERLGKVLRRVGLWRLQWIRRALGGRWEKFLIVKWVPRDVDDQLWLEGGSPEFPPVLVGMWHRVPEWYIPIETTMMRVTLGERSISVGTMRFIEFLGSRAAVVAYYRENW